MLDTSVNNPREKCYKCYRPQSSCMCGYVNSIETRTQFIILMHPKEFQKVKNGSGRLTYLSLSNSELYIGLDFSNHDKINEIIENEDNECYVLYPSSTSLVLNNFVKRYDENSSKKLVLFLIDSTWACSKKMLRLSENLHNLPYMSFYHDKSSEYQIKEQPAEYCLSTIESTKVVLELLDQNNFENLTQESLDKFLNPFYKMIEYQVDKISNNHNSVRFK